MTCPNCHSKIDDTNKYCNYCGKKIAEQELNEHGNQFNYSNQYSSTDKTYDEKHDDQYSYSMLYSNMFNNPISSDDDYLKSYVGPNYEAIKSEKISIPAFVFGPLYLFYRKLWVRATILTIVNIILISYQSSSLSLVCLIAISIYLGLKFNEFYLKHAEKAIEEIKISNPDKTSTELLDVCKKKGGVTMYPIVIYIGIILLFSIIIMSGIFYYSTTQTNGPTENKYQPTSEYKKLENMNYKVPANSRLSQYSNADYHYYTSLDSNNLNCTFTLSTNKYTNLYKTPDDYINRNVFFDSDKDEIIKADTQIKNTNWKYISVASDTRTENFYVTLNNNILYIIEIRGYGDSKISDCKNAENDLINSISFDATQTTK